MLPNNESSGNSKYCCANLEEEVGVVAVSVRYALQDFDLVVAALKAAGGQSGAAVIQHAAEMSLRTEQALQQVATLGLRCGGPALTLAHNRLEIRRTAVAFVGLFAHSTDFSREGRYAHRIPERSANIAFQSSAHLARGIAALRSGLNRTSRTCD